MNNSRLRVGIIAIQHESNTFVRSATTLADFEHDALVSGDEVRTVFQDSKHELGGFFSGLASCPEIEVVPIFAARAVPGGQVEKQTLDHLTATMLQQLRAAGKLDGLLVAPHGAAVCEAHRDMDGYWLEMVRKEIGNSIPLICTLDPHANLSQKMIDLCDATVAYRTNPHLDQFETGYEAAMLMVKTLQGEIQPTQAACLVPVVINIERQNTETEPCLSLYEVANQMLQQPGVLSNSIVLGFPYADVKEMGASFIVVTDNDLELAQELASQLREILVARREQFVAHLIGIDEAIDRAMQMEGPVCLLDMGDNVGGGSSADGTLILHAMQSKKVEKCFVCLYDPDSAQQAIFAGMGCNISLEMGGKSDARLGAPFVATVQVISLHEGLFTEDQIRHGGKTEYNMGASAVVKTESGITILLNSRRTPPFSLKQLTSCGIDPKQFQILVAKGVQAPLGAYREICPNFIRVNTPGPTSADMEQLEYQHRRSPLFPFES